MILRAVICALDTAGRRVQHAGPLWASRNGNTDLALVLHLFSKDAGTRRCTKTVGKWQDVPWLQLSVFPQHQNTSRVACRPVKGASSLWPCVLSPHQLEYPSSGICGPCPTMPWRLGSNAPFQRALLRAPRPQWPFTVTLYCLDLLPPVT